MARIMNTELVACLTPNEQHFADADAEPANIAVWFYDLGFRVFPLIGKQPDSARGTLRSGIHVFFLG